MNVQEIGKRGMLFTFYNPYRTNVFVIIGKNHLFICDTFLGPESMDEVYSFLKQTRENIPDSVVVFNSHADYDHIWGNCFFADSLILAHENLAYEFDKRAKKELEVYNSHRRGEVTLKRPTLFFRSSILFSEEKVLFFSSPGHTPDSASCFDLQEKILFVGDNIEEPFPYINSLDFEQYIKTLELYKTFDFHYLISGHDLLMKDSSILDKNLIYLRALNEENIDIANLSLAEKKLHFSNLGKILSLFPDNVKKDNRYQKFQRDFERLSSELNQNE